MAIVINIALLALGFIGTLAAFGGETWKKGDEPVLGRVTTRGWLSLTCLFCALALGIVKELRNSTEKSGLENQITQMTDQLRQQRLLLAAKRLEEIGDQDILIEELSQQISSVSKVYEHFRNATVRVEGRAQAKDSPPPYKLSFSYPSKDFRLDVCSESFKSVTRLQFTSHDCELISVLSVVRLLPTQAYERNQYGPSIITIIQYLSEMSITHRDALNGPHTVEKQDTPEISLADLFLKAQKWCEIPSTIIATQVNRAKVLRTTEGSAQQLYWLFTYGYASSLPKQAKWLEDQFLGSSSELLVQLPRLKELAGGTSLSDKENAFKLGTFIDSISLNYQQQLKDIEQVDQKCHIKRSQLKQELERLQAGEPAHR